MIDNGEKRGERETEREREREREREKRERERERERERRYVRSTQLIRGILFISTHFPKSNLFNL